MNRAYLVVFIPAILAGIAYVFVFRHEGIPFGWGPLVMGAAVFLAAIALVRIYERRKHRAGGR
jgi:ABC-type spermidine/putrescine transport system permease subunit II